MDDRLVTQTGEVWLGDDGIIRIEIRNPREHTLEDAIECVGAVRRAGGGVGRPLMSRVAAPGPMTSEARAYYASAEAARAITALAMVTNSILGRIVANLLIGLNATPIPMRLFASENAGLIWIKSLGPVTAQEQASESRLHS
ncbi:MAG: hypothetical protein ABW061_20905 [Polyangiaceae bacterium]